MGDDDALVRYIRRDLPQAICNVLIRQAMEPVAADAFGVETLRDRVMVRDRTVAAMEGGIKASNLRHVGPICEQCPNGSEIVRLVQRCQRIVLLEPRQHVVIDQDRLAVVRAAMNNTMTDCRQIDVRELAQPLSCLGNGVGDSRHLIA